MKLRFVCLAALAVPALAVLPGILPAQAILDAPRLSSDHPGILASRITSRRVYSVPPETGPAGLDAVPPDWVNVARMADVVISDDSWLIGYVVEVGGVLGMGSRQVLLPVAMVRPLPIGAESLFVISLSEDEMMALPELDMTLVLR
ncbi:MAG: hypothetical protein ACK5LJ_07105 [Paracoccus sp. (in: a-proteobacteria)]